MSMLPFHALFPARLLFSHVAGHEEALMAKYTPVKIILTQSDLADNTAMSNAHYILRDRGIELKLV